MIKTSMSRIAMTLAVLLGLVAWTERPARACGGFFCDRPQPNAGPPIAQSGENVLFVLGHDPQTGAKTVEAHIQIVYSGAADQFSWVVPVTAAPTLDVGTDALFDRLEPPTRPSYRLMWTQDGTCQGQGGDTGVGCGGASSSPARANGGGAADTTQAPAVDVVFRGNVGPYDSAVIRSDDPTALKTWLTTNGYFVSDAASMIVDDYVAAHSFFVALRLQQGKDTSAIQPIVLRLASEEGCLPLKLTAIAATADVRITVWVLGDARAVPLDYLEVVVNESKLDWFNLGANYDKVLGEAANEAGGDAFAAEFAGPSAAVAPLFVFTGDQIAALASTTSPFTYLSELRMMGILPTGAVLGVLRARLPLPADLAAQGITEAQFYTNPLGLSGTTIANFDAAATTNDLVAAFFTPLAGVAHLFTDNRYLTRLATFISPEEMTKDPRFVTNADLPDVPAQHLAMAHMLCGDQEFDTCKAPVRLDLDDGRQVVYAATGPANVCNSYGRGSLDQLPSASAGFLRDAVGPGHQVVDNQAAITAGLARQNASVPTSAGCSCSVRGRGRPVSGLVVVALVAVVLAWRRRRR